MLSVLLSVDVVFVVACISSVMASPQFDGGRGNIGRQSHSSDNANSGSASSSSGESSGESSPSSTSALVTHRVLIAHAVMATLAWAFLFPMGAIMLRLNINHPIMLKLHIFIQMAAYVIYVAAAGMGIWLAMEFEAYFDVWSDPHLVIGLVVLVCMTIQPVLGWVHHRIYRARSIIIANTNRGPRPGRTIWGRVHLWLGRCLITLGIINGGVGLRMLEDSPSQDPAVTRDAEIGYGVAAGFTWLLYVSVTVVWEATRSARQRKQQYESSSQRQRGSKSQSSSSSDSSLKRESPTSG